MSGPVLTVDSVIEYPDGSIILIRRGKEPYLGKWALPGGRVELGETVEDAATREAFEETGLRIKLTRLVGVYSDPKRDPRRHTVSVVFQAVPQDGAPCAATDAAEITRTTAFFQFDLAFDHRKILLDTFPDRVRQNDD